MKNFVALLVILLHIPNIYGMYLNNEIVLNNESIQESVSFERYRFWLSIQNDKNEYREALIGFSNYANDGIDPFDGALLSGSGFEFFSYLNNSKYAIQCFGLPFDIAKVVDLGYKAQSAGIHKISLAKFDSFFENQDIYLEDLLLNQVINLKNQDYEFNSEVGEFSNRFKIAFVNRLSVDSPVNIQVNDWKVYSDYSNLVIDSPNFQIKQVQIFDLSGKQVYLSSPLANLNSYNVPNLNSNKILIIRVMDANNNVYIKKIKN